MKKERLKRHGLEIAKSAIYLSGIVGIGGAATSFDDIFEHQNNALGHIQFLQNTDINTFSTTTETS